MQAEHRLYVLMMEQFFGEKDHPGPVLIILSAAYQATLQETLFNYGILYLMLMRLCVKLLM